MAFFDGLKGVLVKWLGVVPAQFSLNMTIREGTTKELATLKNQLWYRGDPTELEQYHKQFSDLTSEGGAIQESRFWAATPGNNVLIRKIHSGLPRMLADKIAGIVAGDMNEPDMDGAIKVRWKEFTDDINFPELLKEALVSTLSEGDGAFKICVDKELSPLPLLEFYSGNNVDFKYKRGKLVEIIFYTDYFEKTKHFRLKECYGKNYVKYTLLDDIGNDVGLDALEDTAQLQDVTFAGDFIMGVPLKFYKSPKFKDRGDSIFEGKSDLFDSLDECISTWMDAIRAGRVKQYIPESMLPRNPDDGTILKPDVFNPYIAIGSSLAEDAQDKIETIQGELEFEGLQATYFMLLDSILLGLLSPSTLGIDVKKMDNAEAQREKEKTTLYTRDTLINVLSKFLPILVDAVLKTQDNMKNQAPAGDYEATFEWGQYANPSFESMVETVGKAKTFGIMSLEQCIEELYGDTMTDEDKAEEVARLKEESAVSVGEPAVNDDLDAIGGGDLPEGGKPARAALNGAQLGGLINVLESYGSGQISDVAATNMIVTAFNYTEEEAKKLLSKSELGGGTSGGPEV